MARGGDTTLEDARLASADSGTEPWRAWGPYVSERAWGTVREDYSADGDAWASFPHDHARSRAYRWSEDGMAGVCDEAQQWCLALALWNGADPILKERMFGLGGPDGNHGEDVKEYWWYLDSTPTHSWMSWRYHYPQREFPYADLVDTNARRGKLDPEYELVDTGAFADDRFWAVQVDYAKAAPDDLLMRIRVTNHGPEPATIHVLPTLWWRNTWAWGLPGGDVVPAITDAGGHLVTSKGANRLTLSYGADGRALFCDNETNTQRLWGTPGRTAYPKDGINDHVVDGAATVNPDGAGTKAAVLHVLTVPAGETREVRVRLGGGGTPGDLEREFDEVMAARKEDADDYYRRLLADADADAGADADADADEALVARQAFAGMLWCKQFFHYDVERWLDGDPVGPTPPPERLRGRNHDWRHLNNHDVISMPDTWEYPWYAAWDLAFHTIALAHLDAAFAKDQLILITREWYMHPNGQLPAYEWNFSDVNPPVHAAAALRVFRIDGARDFAFLERIFHKLLLNFTWWVNRKDSEGNNLFEGGFLGLDNIGPIDRSATLPGEVRLEQSDGTAWMAFFCLSMWEISLVLAEENPTYEDMATKFFEHFTLIASAAQRLWDDEDGFFYDVLQTADGASIPLEVRSAVGLLPLAAATTLGQRTLERLPYFAGHMRWYLDNKPDLARVCATVGELDGAPGRLLSVVDAAQLRRLLARMLDEEEFLSPHGVRALSKVHAAHPFVLRVGGAEASVGYEPAESQSGLFGGNSNWRGPVWLPINYLLIDALRRFDDFFGAGEVVECPTGSGKQLRLAAVADELTQRIVSLFIRDETGRRPVLGDEPLFQDSDAWRDLVPFHEYFHGDTGKGLGASHQTGWTGLVADLVVSRRRPPR
jgi:hypothetical protein